MLANAPVWVSAIVMIVVPTLVAMAGPIVVRKYVSLERLSTNNEVAGFKFATVGVLYAVLLAFVVIVVWEKFSDAEADVSREAGWLVLFGGAALTIGFTFFFGTVNLRAQAVMTGALAMLIFSGLLVIVTIDHPFTGAVKVTPEALLEVIHDLGPGPAPAK
jgi:hypothetical protein